MLGTVCFRLCTHRSNLCSPAVVHSYAYHSLQHPFQVTCRHATATSLCRSLSWSRLHAQTSQGDCSVQALGSTQKWCCHSRFCAEKTGEISCATIWHGLVPSHHQSISISSSNNAPRLFTQFQSTFSNQSSVTNGGEEHGKRLFPGVPLSGKKRSEYGLKFPDVSPLGNRKFAMATGLLDGSWNVAWDVRPARWLHGRHSAWLLFGVRACCPVVSGLSEPLPLGPLSKVEDASKDLLEPNKFDFQGKQVFTDYTITGIPGDGRCLFRAIAYGACLREGQLAPSDSSQQDLADELRVNVVDELIRRRADSEWFIEEDFDIYTSRMRECYVWGGEPELLMASHVLRAPIIVYLFHQSSGGITSIAEYGSEYGTENPIRVLYHGFGHYDAVQIIERTAIRVSC
ncbi:hypothetical protein GOP47_0021597 [Adiantum capillus-veneris]|uniref:Ubiquitin thioesterase OTU n=1 Tax=Adiantum capillus-veneris TaxID=13818 RepID=A0A9D4U821_ADICA|nr:hypothetical protein GOP47_0021597 [Adiantum capillus-veneris]